MWHCLSCDDSAVVRLRERSSCTSRHRRRLGLWHRSPDAGSNGGTLRISSRWRSHALRESPQRSPTTRRTLPGQSLRGRLSCDGASRLDRRPKHREGKAHQGRVPVTVEWHCITLGAASPDRAAHRRCRHPRPLPPTPTDAQELAPCNHHRAIPPPARRDSPCVATAGCAGTEPAALYAGDH
ncbi:MAG: hypothetical protein KatS3mg040_0377 [Candidatus Kapaibacterium sp.]|nr:MAG: hypothetical protein KatS3mg040_0377 [Candidatus Kapabacteria bacterium]